MIKKFVGVFLIISLLMQIFGVSVCFADDGQPTVVELNCSNESGDSSYFDNDYCFALVESKYNANFNMVENNNHIELYRLDHMNPKHKNYIYLEKTTNDECYIEISTTNRMSYTQNAGMRYNYYLIEADVRSSMFGAVCDMFLLKDTTGTTATDYVTSCVDKSGNITDANGVNIGSLKRGEWLNYKFAIDIPNKKGDIYIDNKLVKTVSINFDHLDKVICRLKSGEGNGNIFLDNFSVLGLVVPFKNGVDTMTDVFADPPEVEEFLEGKVAFHGYAGIYYKNGVRTHIDNFLYNKDTVAMYVTTDDLKKALDLKSDITVKDKQNIVYNGTTYNISNIATQKDGKWLVSVEGFSKKVLGKYVFSFHTGFFIVGDENEVLDTSDWQYGSFRKTITQYTNLNDIDFLNGFLTYDRPEGDKLKQDLQNTIGDAETAHPRILLNKSQFEHLANLYKTDKNYKYIADKIIATADSYLRQPLLEYTFDDTMRMCVVTGKIQSYFMAWGYAYQITKNQKYVDRAVKEFQNLSKFPDFNVIHMIDSGMAAMGLGCGYDWMYEGMTEEQRQLARYVTYDICLKDVMPAYYGRMSSITSGNGTVKWMSNFNSVVTGGTLMGTLAVLEEDPDVLYDLAAQCIRSLEYAEMGLMPGGGWNESVGYWNYTMEFLTYTLSTLDTTFGTCYGLKTSQGMDTAVDFAMSAIGVGGINSYHDVGNSTANSYKTFMYLANAYQKYDAYAMRHYDIFERKASVTVEDALYYNDEIDMSDVYDKNGTATKVDGTEFFAIRDTYDRAKSQFYFSTHFGTTYGYHQHADCGTFVLDMYGTRFAEDLGSDSYLLENEMGYREYQTYRRRSEGHNVLVFNPKAYSGSFEQVLYEYAPVTDYGYNEKRGFVRADLTSVYDSVNTMKTGYYADKEKMRVTVRSEFDAKPGTEAYWFMHTKANVTIDAVNNRAYLERDGKKICLKFETSGQNPSIFVMDAVPLDTSPQIPEQNKNEGIQKVAIKFDCSGVTNFTVDICGMESADLPVNNSPMISWTVDGSDNIGEEIVANYTDYTSLKTITDKGNVQVKGLYGASEADTAIRIDAVGKNNVASVEFGDTQLPFTIFSANVSGRAFDYGISDGNGKTLNSELNHIDGWNNICVIRRNSDGKYITANNGVFGEWGNVSDDTNVFNVVADIEQGGYIDLDNIKVYHTSTIPTFKSPYIQGVQTDDDFVLAKGEKVSAIGGCFVRGYKDNSFSALLGANDVISDGNVLVAYNDGIYKYYRVTTSPKLENSVWVVNRDDNYKNFSMVRTTVSVVDDIAGNFGKCVRLDGISHTETSIYLETGYLNNYPKVYASVDIYPTESLNAFYFATTGHRAIGPRVTYDRMNKNQWNRVEIEIDTATGKGNVYLNGAYLGSSVNDNITAFRMVFLRKSNTSSLKDLTVYADNFKVHASGDATKGISMQKCTLSGYDISGTDGMTVSEFVNQCNIPNYKYTVKVYGKDRELYSNELVKSGCTVRYYYGDMLINWYNVK